MKTGFGPTAIQQLSVPKACAPCLPRSHPGFLSLGWLLESRPRSLSQDQASPSRGE